MNNPTDSVNQAMLPPTDLPVTVVERECSFCGRGTLSAAIRRGLYCRHCGRTQINDANTSNSRSMLADPFLPLSLPFIPVLDWPGPTEPDNLVQEKPKMSADECPRRHGGDHGNDATIKPAAGYPGLRTGQNITNDETVTPRIPPGSLRHRCVQEEDQHDLHVYVQLMDLECTAAPSPVASIMKNEPQIGQDTPGSGSPELRTFSPSLSLAEVSSLRKRHHQGRTMTELDVVFHERRDQHDSFSTNQAPTKKMKSTVDL